MKKKAKVKWKREFLEILEHGQIRKNKENWGQCEIENEMSGCLGICSFISLLLRSVVALDVL